MQCFRVGSLNINGGRDRQKRALVLEVCQQKRLDVVFLQETHSDADDEVNWGLWWEGQRVLSHGTNFSAGVAVLFASHIGVNVLSSTEIVAGRLLLVKAKIEDSVFNFISIYAPNLGSERIAVFKLLKDTLAQVGQGECVIMGGDWNCTVDFTLDRNREEPHLQSSTCLSQLLNQSKLMDAWRVKYPIVRQYTWVRVLNSSISAARLDRIYLSDLFSSRLLRSFIYPVGFTDHHLVTIDVCTSTIARPRTYWHFNTKLIQDRLFSSKFETFWELWRAKKGDFSSLSQWWEVGKAQIRVFCQQYTSSSTTRIREAVQQLEQEIRDIECSLILNVDKEDGILLKEKKKELGLFLKERVKGAMVRARYINIREIDAPSTFFFNLERTVAQKKQMACLSLPDGRVTTDPAEMRKHAVDFYTALYGAEVSDVECTAELLQELPQLEQSERDALDSELSYEELTTAVNQLAPGRAPGIDGLPAEFFKHFWGCIGVDFREVLLECYEGGSLPTSCCRAALSLLPKKGDLALLKNWRPVALLCTDYKILSKVLANRLKVYLGILIHKDQSYCIPDRSIMDNLHLMRDIIDICKSCDFSIGLLSLDQEKAFDRVDHTFLFSTLKAFGFGEGFISWVQLLYREASVLVKVGGGLSRPISVTRGIRQGCPASGQLYSLAVEPLLARLRSRLTGLSLPGLSQSPPLVVSAYADDITVFIRSQGDIGVLIESLELYGKASSAKVNWGKSEALQMGGWLDGAAPSLPQGLKWGRNGLKVLGVFIGSDEYQKQNWEGVAEKVCARLSRWKWLLPQMSYRGRVLVANNLVASTLWHKMNIVPPPMALVEDVQRIMVDFFWSGHHWLRAAGLYLPLAEGGQGLMDIKSRVIAYRLQTAQRLLYTHGLSWMDTARLLLRRAGRLGYDKHLFLLRPGEADLSGLTPFYSSVLQAWQVFHVNRVQVGTPGMWLLEEPLFFNAFVNAQTLSSVTLRSRLREAGCVKLGHLMKASHSSMDRLGEVTQIRSSRLLANMVKEVCASLPGHLRGIVEDRIMCEQWDDDYEYVFPSLNVVPAVGEWQDEEGSLLSLSNLELGEFEHIGNKDIYHTCIKVSHLRSLSGMKVSKWIDVFGPSFSPKGCWRSLYKPPLEKRTADLQWRIVHGAIATNRYLAHLDQANGEECSFCAEVETLSHLFVQCPRLAGLFELLGRWYERFGEVFSFPLFIFGPRYSVNKKAVQILINCISGIAKIAIWKTRKNRTEGLRSVDPVQTMKGLLSSRLRVEHAYFTLVDNMDGFMLTWGLGGVLCEVHSDGTLILSF